MGETIQEIFEETKSGVCDNICKYASQRLTQEELDKKCEECPLNLLP